MTSSQLLTSAPVTRTAPDHAPGLVEREDFRHTPESFIDHSMPGERVLSGKTAGFRQLAEHDVMHDRAAHQLVGSARTRMVVAARRVERQPSARQK